MKPAAALLPLMLAGCGLFGESHDCPDHYRLELGFHYPKDQIENELHVDDCLAEYGGKLARGPSSDNAVAQAAISYCGTYGWGATPDSPELLQKEEREALGIVVADRAFKCPAPRERDPITYKLK